MDDTHPEARRVQIELLRKAGPQRRLRMALELTDSVWRMARAGIARARPDLSEQERRLLFVEVHYGRALADRLRAFLSRRTAA